MERYFKCSELTPPSKMEIMQSNLIFTSILNDYLIKTFVNIVKMSQLIICLKLLEWSDMVRNQNYSRMEEN